MLANLELQKNCSGQIWCKKVQTRRKSKPKMVIPHLHTSLHGCKFEGKCGIYHLYLNLTLVCPLCTIFALMKFDVNQEPATGSCVNQIFCAVGVRKDRKQKIMDTSFNPKHCTGSKVFLQMVVAAMFREIFQQEGHKFPPVHVLTFNLVPLRLKNRRTKFKRRI